ncbi:MAG: 4Fe-4S dicluster domain-containing protein [Candidatus Odinarchaeota archaeon]
MSNGNIVDAVKRAGVVGAGGAGFPTHVKLAAKVDTYIANGAECEPLLEIDQHLMEKYPEKIVKGLQLGMESTGAKKGIIALKKKYLRAIEAIKGAIKDDERLEMFFLDNVYPSGDEFLLVYEILGLLIPERGLPLDVGVVVNNIGTLINIANACEGKPVITRYVTVTGAVKEPQTLELPIGTPVSVAIEAAGGPVVKPYKIISGGPMMGRVINSPETAPITKTSSGLIVLPENHFVITMKEQRMSSKVVVTKAACIRCQLCTEFCPRFLLGHDLYPDKVMRAIAFGGKTEPKHLTTTFLCIACWVCTIVCPMILDPCRINLEVRDNLISEGLQNPHKRADLQVHQDRKWRLFPIKRLISRLDLVDYDHPAPLVKRALNVSRVRIPLKQHIGAPAIPTVSVGDKVSKGDLIGKIPDGSLGAAVHASISGVVEQVTDTVTVSGTAKNI